VTRVIAGAPGILASEGEDCDDAPAPPDGGDEEFMVCFTVWREVWFWDYLSGTYQMSMTWIIAMYCYVTTLEA
jgi:hypothetical protein